jgi:hypothetical protein
MRRSAPLGEILAARSRVSNAGRAALERDRTRSIHGDGLDKVQAALIFRNVRHKQSNPNCDGPFSLCHSRSLEGQVCGA